MESSALSQQSRKYIRLDSVFPVEFQVIGLDDATRMSEWLQGFTRNVSKGGICLEVNRLPADVAALLRSRQAKLSLKIEMPVLRSPVPAVANIVWIKEPEGHDQKYVIGLSYEEIDRCQNSKIMFQARLKKIILPVAAAIILILASAFLLGTYFNMKLVRGNKAAVEQLVKTIQESSFAKQKIREITGDREELLSKIQALQLRIETVENEKARAEQEKIVQAGFSPDIHVGKLMQEKSALEDSLIRLQQKESAIAEELLQLDQRKARLEKTNLDKMYHWLAIHQNHRTGLVMSFEGDGELTNWAFVYDQSLAAQAYLILSDFERAKKVLAFFAKKAQRSDGLFYNAYYSNDSTPAEFTVHCGPNLWLGIAIIQYSEKTKDNTFMKLAEEIAQAIIRLQMEDQDGGLRGGPNVEWYSTEHNLDAYAFFNMLYKRTGKSQYRDSRDKILHWLNIHTYDKEDVPVIRGKGDATIATDTYAWSIAAIGPQKLEEIGMNPDMIMDFAEKNCAVEVDYIRPEGKAVKIKGFDFAPQRHLGRGGVVSAEWTSQMVISFKIMADFYYKKKMPAKARGYELKADNYLTGLGNMIISSPSPSGQGDSCLPYATQENVDTGHGWMTPKGKTTGSVAGTAYTLFAYYNYNPLKLKE
ncbi:MAG: PilZ domain-containing protein [Candidatus Omnitrophota bacterium]